MNLNKSRGVLQNIAAPKTISAREIFEWQYGVVVFKNCGFSGEKHFVQPIKEDTSESLNDISISLLKIGRYWLCENSELLEEK